MFEMLLAIATILGGIAAVGYFLEKVVKSKKATQDATGGTRLAISPDFKAKPTDPAFAEKTYFQYRLVSCPLLESNELVSHLETRYGCEALRFGSSRLPVTVLWRNTAKLIRPDIILGEFDGTVPKPFTSSPLLSSIEYQEARDFIRRQYEAPPSPIRYEGCDYRMTHLDLLQPLPKLQGAYGLYYDNILTQYAMEWELKKALLQGDTSQISKLTRPGSLPLREAVEKGRNPLTDGTGRCAAITISTLIVFQRSTGEYYTIIRRRSTSVAVSPGLHHIVPAGMFEAPNTQDVWSIETNIWRELLEEIYDEEEQLGHGVSELHDYLRAKMPIKIILELIDNGRAELSVTGICCDLLNLRPEICTVLYIADPRFAEARRMVLNWEYEKEGAAGTFGIQWNRIDKLAMSLASASKIVVSGAACLSLGREWLAARHQI